MHLKMIFERPTIFWECWKNRGQKYAEERSYYIDETYSISIHVININKMR